MLKQVQHDNRVWFYGSCQFWVLTGADPKGRFNSVKRFLFVIARSLARLSALASRRSRGKPRACGGRRGNPELSSGSPRSPWSLAMTIDFWISPFFIDPVSSTSDWHQLPILLASARKPRHLWSSTNYSNNLKLQKIPPHLNPLPKGERKLKSPLPSGEREMKTQKFVTNFRVFIKGEGASATLSQVKKSMCIVTGRLDLPLNRFNFI